MAGARGPPRRKQSSPYQLRTEGSWQMLDASENNAMDIDSTDMEGDERGNETEQSSFINEHPIRHVADRVGREVEAFAEKLDAWSNRPRRTTDDKHKAAADLVDDFAAIAEETVRTLRRRHGASLESHFKRSWLKNHTNIRGANDRSIGLRDDDEEEDSSYENSTTTVEDLKRWQSELHTWQLMQKILACRYPTSDEYDDELVLTRSKDDRFASDGALFKSFINKNKDAKERLLVLKWLEQIAEVTEHDVEIIEREAEESSRQGKGLFFQGWMNTKEKIKGHKRLRLWSSPISSNLPEIWNSDESELIVTQLDGDAATRQRRTLENGDLDFEKSFWTVCWEMFRHGFNMDFIRDWCNEKNEFARAFSMGTQEPSPSSADKIQNFGRRYTWRRVCLQLARYGGLSDQERAVFALLGGDFEPVSKICLSREDFLYAHYNAQLIAQFETSIYESHRSKFSAHPLQDLGVVKEPFSHESLATVARRLNTSLDLDPRSQIEESNGLKIIQANLIAHNIGNFIIHQAIGLSRASAEDDSDPLVYANYADLLPDVEDILLVTGDDDTVRVLAHMYLIFQDLGVDFGTGDLFLAVENVLGKYITFLRLIKKIELIPHYASHLTKERAEYALATVCQNIFHTSEMTDYLNLITSDGIDITMVMRFQYALALSKSPLGDPGNWTSPPLKLLAPASGDEWPYQQVTLLPQQEAKEDEMRLIHAGEWYRMLKGHFEMSLNTLARIAVAFLENGRLQAAMDLYDRLPFAEVSATKSVQMLGRAINVMADDSDDDDDEINRKSTLEALLVARPKQNRLRSAREQTVATMKEQGRIYHELGQLVNAIRAIQDYAIVEKECIKTPGSGKEELGAAVEELANTMEPLFKPGFLTSRWSEDKTYRDDQEKNLVLQEHNDLASIRANYLPELILAYISALHYCGFAISRQTLVQVMALSTDIAENEGLTRAFAATGRMGELVDAFAASSKALLKLNEINGKSKKRKSRVQNSFHLWDISV